MDATNNQMAGCINILDAKNSPGTYFMDGRYYYPMNMMVSASVENINIITTENKLAFGSEIIFDLGNCDLGECIEIWYCVLIYQY